MLSYSKTILTTFSCLSVTRLISAAASSTYKAHERSKFMQKLINKKGAKNKKHWYKPHLGEPLEVGQRKPKKGITHGHSIRLRQLSHVLYDKITEIINTGELSQQILDAQVAITSAAMTKDLTSLNVYWDADRTDWTEVEQILQLNAGKLRSLLISYHILGRIPHIVFVKNKAGANISQLNQLFDKADYGPDYIPCGLQAPNTLDSDYDVGYINDITCNNEETFNTMKTQENPEDRFVNTDHVTASADTDHCIGNTSHVYHDLANGFIDSKLKEQKNLDNLSKSLVDYESLKESQVDNHDMDLSGDNSGDDDIGRSNLYGLDRDQMMKKVVSKKLKSSFENEMELNKLEFNDRYDVIPNLHSVVGANRIMRQKREREERKQKLKLLERDSV